MPSGNAKIAIPITDDIIVITFPAIETAYMSLYPSVVKDIVYYSSIYTPLLMIPNIKMCS